MTYPPPKKKKILNNSLINKFNYSNTCTRKSNKILNILKFFSFIFLKFFFFAHSRSLTDVYICLYTGCNNPRLTNAGLISTVWV